MQNKFYQCVQNDNEDASIIDNILAIKKAGFDGCFVQIYDNPFWPVSQEEQVRICQKEGIHILFAHLGYYLIDDMWRDGSAGEARKNLYIKDIDYCKQNNIDLVVMHICSNRFSGEPNIIGLKRYQDIVDYAGSLGIKVAFENTKNLKFFEYIVDNINGDNVGVCYDSGHCHCFYENDFNWDKIKGKILAVHLHDNDGTDDQHLLPEDGNIDWAELGKKLDEAGYNGPVTLESCYRYFYKKDNIYDFYAQSLDRAKEMAQKLTIANENVM